MTAPRQDDTRRAFDAAAADFTALGHYLWGPIGAATAMAARLRPGDRVLDACCGTALRRSQQPSWSAPTAWWTPSTSQAR